MRKKKKIDISLSNYVSVMINSYLQKKDLDKVTYLYSMVLELIEPPLLKSTIEHSKYNQSRAAECLGISRSNLRNKLIRYFEDQYCGYRDKL